MTVEKCYDITIHKNEGPKRQIKKKGGTLVLSPEENQVLGEYYKQEYSDLFSFANNTLKNEHLAEVAVQETFLVATNKFKKF